MRTLFLLLAAIAIPLQTGCGAKFVNQGSRNATLALDLAPPASPKSTVKVTAAQKIICDFENGAKEINRGLYGKPDGGWFASSWGGNTVSGNLVEAGGPAKSRMAAHVYGTLVDRGDSQYPGFTLTARFRNAGPYDASPFSGIRFHYKCPDADTAAKRRFSIPTAPTLPPMMGGTCARGCWNHFGADLAPTDEWELKSFSFSELKREAGWGSPVMPPDLADHLARFIALQWSHSGSNVPATYQIDYWVDGVEFF